MPENPINWYDRIAFLYDPFVLGVYNRARRETVAQLQLEPGQRVLDLACGTGENFRYLMPQIGQAGVLVGADYYRGMLTQAHRKVARAGWKNISLLHAYAQTITLDAIAAATDQPAQPFDRVLITLGMTVIPDWKAAFERAWALLKPGGRMAIRRWWGPLEGRGEGFHRNFFEKRGGYPKFKSKRSKQSIRYPQPKPNWIAPDGRHIYLPKVGYVRLIMHRPLEGVMKNVIVSKTRTGKYFVSFQVEAEIAKPTFSGGAVGIDLGLRDFVTLSTGEKIAPPQYYRKAQKKRRRLARQLSRKKPGSRNREKAHLRLARLDERIANQRRDFQHKLSHLLVEENQFIALEDLNVRGMMANHHLAKSIGDAGWSAFITMLIYKGDWYGCRVEKVSRWYPSSKTCSACGTVMVAIPLHVREWQCHVCGVVHDRDVNAATNILNQSTVGATGSHAWGQCVDLDLLRQPGNAGRTRKPTCFSGW